MPSPHSSIVSERLPEIRAANLSLIQAFGSHPQFSSQQSQRSGKIYFMWDFASRTNAVFESILYNQLPPDTPATRNTIPNVPSADMNEEQKNELKQDAIGRCFMLKEMISDTTGMTGMMFGEAPGRGVDVGDAVRTAANNVDAVILGNEEGATPATT